MNVRLTRLALALAVCLASLIGFDAGPAHAVNQKDCSDFSTQKAAQNWFIDHGGPQQDPSGLDDDGDGVACESNPCPCSTDQGGGGGGGGGDNPQPQTERDRVRILKVLRGDLARVKYIGKKGRPVVQLLGIDAPHLRGDCHGDDSLTALKKRLPRGLRVQIVSDTTQRNKDGAGRLLRYVIKRSGDVGRNMAYTGQAQVVRKGANFKRQAAYNRAENHAQRQDLGIWGPC